jgi:hypothetical protein
MLVVDQGTRTSIYPIHYIPSSLPHYDICLFVAPRSKDHQPLPSLPVSPYPVHAGTKARAHFVTDTPPPGEEDHWFPCFDSKLYRRWVSGEVRGYRDFAGNEVQVHDDSRPFRVYLISCFVLQPGRYDTLAHMSFMPIPTPGSSGGPIVDEESGAVVGLIRGSKLDNRHEGLRGWAVPAEAIYEVFILSHKSITTFAADCRIH